MGPHRHAGSRWDGELIRHVQLHALPSVSPAALDAGKASVPKAKGWLLLFLSSLHLRRMAMNMLQMAFCTWYCWASICLVSTEVRC